MTQRLTDMAITRVSLVDKGANARVMAILKKQEDAMTDPEAPPTGAIAWLRKALRLEDVEVAKAPATFAEIVAGQELADAIADSRWTLEDALWSAMYAQDENGQALSMEAKQALVSQNLDEYKAYLLGQMASDVTKSRPSLAGQAKGAVTAAVAKVGKKISGSRLERLMAASDALTSVLDEVAEAVAAEADTAEETPVEKAELIAAMTEALEPVTKRLEALETKPAPVVKTGTTTEGEGDDEVTLATIAEAVEKIADRIEVLEGGASVRKSIVGQDGAAAGGTEPVKKSVFAGIFG